MPIHKAVTFNPGDEGMLRGLTAPPENAHRDNDAQIGVGGTGAPVAEVQHGARRIFSKSAKSSATNDLATRTSGERGSFLRDAAQISTDARRICNTMKRMSAIVVASMQDGVDPELVVSSCERIAQLMMRRLGVDEDSPRADFSYAMMMEAASTIIATCSSFNVNSIEFNDRVEEIVDLMMCSLKNRSAQRIIENEWPNDIDTKTSMHFVMASAMSNVALEIAAGFRLCDPSEIIKPASQLIARKATEATRSLLPEGASDHTRAIFTQSMISSASRIYAGCWKAKFAEIADFINKDESGRDKRVATIRISSQKIIGLVAQRFESIFDSSIQCSLENTDVSNKLRAKI